MASRDKIEYSGPLIEEVSEFPDGDSINIEPKMLSANGEIGGSLTDFGQKKSSTSLLSKISSSSANFSTSSTEQRLKSSSSTSVTSKKAQIRHAVASSASTSCQEMKQQQQNEIYQQKENRNFSRSVSVTSNASSSSDSRLKLLSGFSVEDEDSYLSQDHQALQESESIKFGQQQQQRVTSSKVKMNSSSTSAEGYTEEKVAAINQERKQVRSGSISYEESSTSAALQHKLEADGFTAEKVAALRQDQRQLKTPDSLQQQQRTSLAASMKLSTDEFTAEKVAVAKQEEKRSFSSHGLVQEEKNMSSSSTSKVTFTSKNSKCAIASQNLHQVGFEDMSTSNLGMMSLKGANIEPFSSIQNKDTDVMDGMDQDIALLKNCHNTGPEFDKAIQRFKGRMFACVEKLKTASDEESITLLDSMSSILENAWAVPNYGHDLGSTMCETLLKSGSLGILIKNCTSTNSELQFRSAKVLEQSLTTENRAYVVENGLEQVVKVACSCSAKCSSSYSRVGTGLLEHLFKHSEATCSDVIRMDGLKAILAKCRYSDIETLRHCATALANLSLYGGPENQQAMIKHKVHVWLFPLAFHPDIHIKYYACLAISSLVANKEIEAAVLKSGTLDLVEPFVTSHSPEVFAKSHIAHAHGQSKNWLQRLVNVLDSKREEARNLAAFHFAMEAGIKKKQGNTEVFHEVGAVEALKKVASSPNAIASKFAAQALHLIGEKIPHKLSQQVPLWTVEDVQEWVKQIGFSQYCAEFSNSRVDGDLLLQLTEEMLRDDIGIKNGILRKRFLRELNQLKKMTDYTSCDSTYVNQILLNLGSEFCQYTYQLLHCGVQKDTLKYITEEQLMKDCGIENSIHRLRIIHAIQGLTEESENAEAEDKQQKPLDVFISYRRSNGSQLASLLKVHLQLRGFSVFIDVERLEAGKFDNNLLQSIRQAKHFILVLTQNALDRCVNDTDCKDWVHKEIVEALQSQCNIVPILDHNFQWPESEKLPDDMKAVSYFNGVRWIHDYQDACVDKLERFMRGEMNVKNDGLLSRFSSISSGGAGTPGITGPGTMGLPPVTKTPHPVYQRSTSNDSGKGAPLEKEFCNGAVNGERRSSDIPQHNNF